MSAYTDFTRSMIVGVKNMFDLSDSFRHAANVAHDMARLQQTTQRNALQRLSAEFGNNRIDLDGVRAILPIECPLATIEDNNEMLVATIASTSVYFRQPLHAPPRRNPFLDASAQDAANYERIRRNLLREMLEAENKTKEQIEIVEPTTKRQIRLTD